MIKDKIISKLKELTSHDYVEVLDKGNSAIFSALHAADGSVLIPEEGGWLTYQTYPKKLGLKSNEVKTKEAVIDLEDLKRKFREMAGKNNVFLYQNPGGYFAEEPMKEIYQICKKNNCWVILDVSGGIGTKLCDGKYADVIVGSFGKWKLVEAKIGGFISCKDEKVFNQIKKSFKILDNEKDLKIILEKLNELPKRIKFLSEKRKKIIKDLFDFEVLNKNHLGFVVVVGYKNNLEKEKIINYCGRNKLDYTECPRYIRVNKKAISIEVKRLRE